MTHVSELSWNEFAERAPRVPYWIVVAGSVEQHGPHLPLGADTLVVQRLAREACEMHGALVLDTISVGVLFRYREWPGCLAVSDDVVEGRLLGLTSAITPYNNRLLVLNGHDENHEPLVVAARRAVDRYGTDVVVVEWAQLVSDVIRGVSSSSSESHAGEALTSLFLHWYPQQVRHAAIAPGVPAGGWITRDDLHVPVRAHHVARLTHDEAPSGVVGDPTPATAAKGEEIAKALVDRIHLLVDERGWL